MGSEATSAALDEHMADAERSPGAAADRSLAELLAQSPEANEAEARQRIDRLVSRLDRLGQRGVSQPPLCVLPPCGNKVRVANRHCNIVDTRPRILRPVCHFHPIGLIRTCEERSTHGMDWSVPTVAITFLTAPEETLNTSARRATSLTMPLTAVTGGLPTRLETI